MLRSKLITEMHRAIDRMNEISDERAALVLRPGDIVVIRHKTKTLEYDVAERVKEIYSNVGVKAIVMGCDWDVVRSD